MTQILFSAATISHVISSSNVFYAPEAREFWTYLWLVQKALTQGCFNVGPRYTLGFILFEVKYSRERFKDLGLYSSANVSAPAALLRSALPSDCPLQPLPEVPLPPSSPPVTCVSGPSPEGPVRPPASPVPGVPAWDAPDGLLFVAFVACGWWVGFSPGPRPLLPTLSPPHPRQPGPSSRPAPSRTPAPAARAARAPLPAAAAARGAPSSPRARPGAPGGGRR